jgi:hypothetical protein
LTFMSAGAPYEAGEVENALGDDLATVHIGQGHELARNPHTYRTVDHGSVPSTQQNGLAPLEPGRICPTDGQRRDVVQRGLNGQ